MATPGPQEVDFRQRLTEWGATSSRLPSFTGGSKDLPEWFQIIESACEDNDVDKSNWVEAAIMFISGDLKHVMDERRLKYLEKSPEESFWGWDDFKDDITRLVVEGERIKSEAEAANPLGAARDAMYQFRLDHPHIVASAGVGLAVSGSIVIVPALGVLALKAIGFTVGRVAFGALTTVARAAVFSGATTGIASALGSVIKPLWLTGAQDEGREELGHPPPGSSQEPGPPEHIAVPTRRLTLNERLAAASRSKHPAVAAEGK